ncbi:hypothetical protein A2303_02400 [Candidatus Falkowbacteria bacterium RIFOXYB2_FULL_47_14]|uniref:DUF2283 domain-containing protein n=1 Tax=Candidatus Falkowbacteria bacterium RIFOXYA2_FULL_47_19 TaxID=1797994 RepID=A0A1F5SFF8_9BACT|nr:MAG: hypothetical protein A2227_07580 [Candidatus Falkowbacteria bacterium RIFOXYA2_FULL_47_19]OGF35271.1 MAG: hypothetical protein A2468_01210 [Candidatus Falkowbacteria bacterium RIFOXYC2_FULL_46_15]OGF43913.1 MAG: hypothetical protein A2303_02400 [Candidatus Falkowbacteria bacterium RIFOXYB2_FULL_47_14]
MLYDPEANILSWEVSKGEISHAHEFGNFIIHLSKAGKPILIEMLDASKFIGQFEKVKNLKDIKSIEEALPVN